MLLGDDRGDDAFILHPKMFHCAVVLISVRLSCTCGNSGSALVKVLCYNSEGRWFDPSWCQWIFH